MTHLLGIPEWIEVGAGLIGVGFALGGIARAGARQAGVLSWPKNEIRSAIGNSLRAVLDRIETCPQINPLIALRAALQQDGELAEFDAIANETCKTWLGTIHPDG